jgi:hypothetical protein
VRRPRRAIRPKLGDGARRVKLVWPGLRRAKGRKLARTVVVPVTIVDKRGKRFGGRLRVKRG